MKISAIVINKNEETFLEDCLESLKWADEIIFSDGGSTDNSLAIAKAHKAKIFKQTGNNFAEWRTEVIKMTKGEWILYLDADERISPLLRKEIEETIKKTVTKTVYAIPRRNLLLGKELCWGGWYPDYVKRLFYKKNLKEWMGNVHEEPVFHGEMGKLENPMIHLQPEKIEPAFQKSIKWTAIEADLLFKVNHPKIVWWRVLRMGVTTLFERLIKKQGYRDGIEGWIESIFQSFHTMIVYIRLWEMQLKKQK